MAQRHVTLGEIETVIVSGKPIAPDKDGNARLVMEMNGFRFKVVVSKETVGSQHPFVITVTKDPA